MKNLLQRMILCKNFRRYVVLVSQLLLIASLTQDFYACFPVLWVFLFGWMGLYFNWSALAWFANPLLIIAWRTFTRERPASLVFSLLAVVFALTFLFFKRMYNPNSEEMYTTTGYNAFYWLWLAASCVMLIANLSLFMVKKIAHDTQS